MKLRASTVVLVQQLEPCNEDMSINNTALKSILTEFVNNVNQN